LHTYRGRNGPREAAIARQLGSSITAPMVTFDGASAPGMAPAVAVVVVAGAPPPSNQLAQEASV
jgi:hypothetical protein